jgi:hypothetical protein
MVRGRVLLSSDRPHLVANGTLLRALLIRTLIIIQVHCIHQYTASNQTNLIILANTRRPSKEVHTQIISQVGSMQTPLSPGSDLPFQALRLGVPSMSCEDDCAQGERDQLSRIQYSSLWSAAPLQICFIPQRDTILQGLQGGTIDRVISRTIGRIKIAKV